MKLDIGELHSISVVIRTTMKGLVITSTISRMAKRNQTDCGLWLDYPPLEGSSSPNTRYIPINMYI